MKFKKILYIWLSLTSVLFLYGCSINIKDKTTLSENNSLENELHNEETENREDHEIIQYTKEKIWSDFCTSDKIRDNCKELTGKQIQIKNINFLSGNNIDLTNKDKYIIEIMAVDCYHCNNSMEHVINYDNQENNIPIYTCSFADDPVTINEWMKEKEFEFDMGMIEYDFVKYDLGIKYTPCFLFVEKGEIKLAYIGEIKNIEFIETLKNTAYKE